MIEQIKSLYEGYDEDGYSMHGLIIGRKQAGLSTAG